VIASRLQASKRESPHFYASRDAPLDALLLLRAQLLAERGLKASVNDFLVRAAALALAQHPAAAALSPHSPIDLAVAVALPGGGLNTPLVRSADRLSLAEVSAAVKELAARAREGRLKPEEYTGGAMSLSNLRSTPVTSFAAILNPPQAAILAVGTAQKRAALSETGELRSEAFLSATLTVDASRVQAGDAAAYLEAFAALLGEPQRLL
jgi:pyruvate dehydrogenase E2 component (dihydrolipoamide acetyltransferase)